MDKYAFDNSIMHYFIDNPIAITFNSKSEHGKIINFFNKLIPKFSEGVCSFFVEKRGDYFISNYRYSKNKENAFGNNYLIISFERFLETITYTEIKI